MSYIERETALQIIDNYAKTVSEDGKVVVDAIRDIVEVITPTADVVEVVHAYWKATTHITESKRGREIHSTLYNCSNCDAPNGRKKSSYCHWCGAKMDEKEQNHE